MAPFRSVACLDSDLRDAPYKNEDKPQFYYTIRSSPYPSSNMRRVFVVLLVAATFPGLTVGTPHASDPCRYKCPPFDKEGFALGRSNESFGKLRCSYPVDDNDDDSDDDDDEDDEDASF